jgi:hypothetical protein
MTRERVISMDQTFLVLDVERGGSAGKTGSTAHGFLATRQNASVCTVPRVYPGNVR